MKRIKYIIWYVRNKFHIWRNKRKMTLGPKGLYIVKYIADKYFLSINPSNFIQEYERVIESTKTRMIENKIFERLNIEPNQEDAAFFSFVNFVIFASEAQKNEIYNYLKDWKYLDLFKNYIRQGIVL